MSPPTFEHSLLLASYIRGHSAPPSYQALAPFTFFLVVPFGVVLKIRGRSVWMVRNYWLETRDGLRWVHTEDRPRMEDEHSWLVE
ncbi:hypothetical protein NMY22_g19134 [Coprinellus aureogranulatus]|nr:hypothetical protein NMY22_g19134 [Coprinellus aureogranulatus]